MQIKDLMRKGLHAELECTVWTSEADATAESQKLRTMSKSMRTHTVLPHGLRRVDAGEAVPHVPHHFLPPRYRHGQAGLSVFQLAVLGGDLRVVGLLLELRADPNFR